MSTLSDLTAAIAADLPDNARGQITAAKMRELETAIVTAIGGPKVADIRDFGAQVDGTTNDADAIEAAIASGVGSVYIPPGTTLVTRPVRLDLTGLSAPKIFGAFGDNHNNNISNSNVFGNFAGPIFSCLTAVNGPTEICNLSVYNANAAGIGIHIANGSAGVNLHDLFVVGQVGIWLGANCFSSHLHNCYIRNSNTSVPDGSASGTILSGSIGIISMGSNCLIENCDFNGQFEAMRLGGTCMNVLSNRIEVCDIGFNLGIDESGNDYALQSSVIAGTELEAVKTGFYLHHVAGCSFLSNQSQGSTNAPGGESAYGFRVVNIQGSLVASNVWNGRFSVAAVALETRPFGCVFSNNHAENSIGPDWVTTSDYLSWGNAFLANKAGVSTTQFPLRTPNVQASNYTFAIGDETLPIEGTATTGVTYNLQPDASINFDVGSIIQVTKMGAGGSITILPSAPCVVHSPSAAGSIQPRTQYSTIYLRKRAANDWIASGDLA
jgi:hypothetical protein